MPRSLRSVTLLLIVVCIKQLCPVNLSTMYNLSNPTADDTAELVDDEGVGIRYRLRKCGTRRLVIISLVLLLVVGAVVVVAVIVIRGHRGMHVKA